MSVFSPDHRTWLIRGAVAIVIVGAIATWLASLSDSPPPTSPSAEAQVQSRTTASAIAELARRATVLVVATDRRGEVIGQGTGFFVSADGLLATNYHVIEGARGLRIQTMDGNTLAEVYLVATDSTRDLAMLRVKRMTGAFLRVAAHETPAAGDPVYVMGNPLGQVGTFSTGVVSATREIRGRELVQITAPVSPGSSGGPVLNGSGEVVGVATLNLRDGQNLNFAVSARYLPAMMAGRDNAVLFADAMRVTASGLSERGRAEPIEAGLAATETTNHDFSAEISRQFAAGDSIVRSIGYIRESPVVHEYLEEGRLRRHPVTLDRAGTYLIQAYCDVDCSQMAMSIRDVDDSVIDSDEGSTDHPTLVFSVAATGRYELRLTMLSCSVSPCAYGVRLYRAIRRSSP